jgi:hypothetical protein
MTLGESLVAAKMVVAEDVAEALARQRKLGGTLGDNLVAMGKIDRARLEAFLEQGPPKLGAIADTGLDASFLQTLALKAMYALGGETPTDISEVLMLPVPVVREAMEGLRGRSLLETLGAEGAGLQSDLRYGISRAGRDWVQEALKQSEYVGPAPVPLASWQAQVERQRITNDRVNQAAIAKSLEGLVLTPNLIARFGPAVNAGRGMLLYGAPGDGKTSIATAIAKSFHQSIWVPYAIEVEREIIKIFDPAVHREVAPAPPPQPNGEEARRPSLRVKVSNDGRRWVRCARPIAVIGGELSMDMLDLKFEPVARYYEAPQHIKVTGGVFVIDDFGRQVARPEQVLNRWILPLETRIDYLTLHTGKKFAVAFDGLVIFSTNLTPRTIMDAAMIRRIPYNFFIGPPTADEYVEIFRRVCLVAKVPFDIEAIKAVMQRLYGEEKLPLSRFHPKFIVDHVLARCTFEGREATLDKDLALEAAGHLYTKG